MHNAPHRNPRATLQSILLLLPFYRWRNWVPGRLSSHPSGKTRECGTTVHIFSPVFYSFFFFKYDCLKLAHCCVSFCCAMKGISSMSRYIPSLSHLPHTPHLIPPGHHREIHLQLSVLYSCFPPASYFTHDSVHPNLPNHPALPSPLACPHVHLLFLPC